MSVTKVSTTVTPTINTGFELQISPDETVTLIVLREKCTIYENTMTGVQDIYCGDDFNLVVEEAIIDYPEATFLVDRFRWIQKDPNETIKDMLINAYDNMTLSMSVAA